MGLGDRLLAGRRGRRKGKGEEGKNAGKGRGASRQIRSAGRGMELGRKEGGWA